MKTAGTVDLTPQREPESRTSDAADRAWHALESADALAALDSSPRGLTQAEAESRVASNGPNALEAGEGLSLAALVLAQLRNPLVYLLAGAAVVSALAGKVLDAGVIVLIVAANTVIGVAQEYRAEQALEALRRLSSPRARVLRDGDMRLVDATEVAVGDVLVLETGDRVAADARVIDSTDLRIDESALTGETEPVGKRSEPVPADAPLADRTSLVFSSTPVVGGRGTAVVVAIGMATVVGTIAGEVRSAERQVTPLQAGLARLSSRLGWAAVIAAASIFGLGVWRGETLVEMLLFSVAAAVSAIPEGLPTAVSVSLALGVQRMARRNAIVKRLPAVETLGSCTVVCTDKTGTLTRNEMTVTRLWADGHAFAVTGVGFAPEGGIVDDAGTTAVPDTPLSTLLTIGCIVNNAVLERDEEGRWRVEGNPTDGALLVAARKAGVSSSDVRCDRHRTAEIPFSSQCKYMATVDRDADGSRLHVKGAPDRMLGYCDRLLTARGVVPLDDALRNSIRGAAAGYAAEALRVIAAAYKDLPEGQTTVDRAEAENGLVFVGLWGLLDPPRSETIHAIDAAKRGGIAVKMITGDHAATGRAIAVAVGILPEDAPPTSLLTGVELDALSDDELEGRVAATGVFARVEPRHKLRIVQALQRRGEVVAMTGDGVNDAPALKRADIGVAMGITGTEVSKEAADMVLADDDFATIVAAVEEGRVIYGNLRRVVAFLLTIAAGEVLAIMACQIVGWPVPVTAVMILWVNLVVASACTIPLGVEPQHDDVLSDPPRPPSEGILAGQAIRRIIVGAVVNAVGVLAVFGYYLQSSTLVHAQTMAFMTLVAFEWAQAIGARSWRAGPVRLGLFSNRSLIGGLAVAVALQWVAVSSPAAERLLGTEPIGGSEWVLALAVGSVGFLAATVMNRVFSDRPGASHG